MSKMYDVKVLLFSEVFEKYNKKLNCYDFILWIILWSVLNRMKIDLLCKSVVKEIKTYDDQMWQIIIYCKQIKKCTAS